MILRPHQLICWALFALAGCSGSDGASTPTADAGVDAAQSLADSEIMASTAVEPDAEAREPLA